MWFVASYFPVECVTDVVCRSEVVDPVLVLLGANVHHC
jgi:hypothetical protein